MKRVKVMLTALTVLAVVGGALAFKATTFGQGSIYCLDDNNRCTRLIDYVVTTGAGTNDPCGTGDKKFGTVSDPDHACPTQNLIATTTAL